MLAVSIVLSYDAEIIPPGLVARANLTHWYLCALPGEQGFLTRLRISTSAAATRTNIAYRVSVLFILGNRGGRVE